MNFGAARLGFWFIGQGLVYTPFYPLNYWSSNQVPPQSNTYAELFFNPNGTISLTTTSSASPLVDLPTNWKVNDIAGSEYEIRATIEINSEDQGGGYYQVFGLANNTPAIGSSTSWYNLGTARSLKVQLSNPAGVTDYTKLRATIDIGLAGQNKAIISALYVLDIGAI